MAEPKHYGRMITGELLTEELIEKLSREAERGWEVEDLLRWDAEAKAAQAPGIDARTASPQRPRRRR